MHWKQWPVGGKSTVTIRFFLFVAVLLCVPSGPAFVKGDLVRHVLAADQPLWPHEKSDLKPDPELVFGRLDNGFRYVLLRNEQPEGRVSMHLNVQAGSVHEKENERGLAATGPGERPKGFEENLRQQAQCRDGRRFEGQEKKGTKKGKGIDHRIPPPQDIPAREEGELSSGPEVD